MLFNERQVREEVVIALAQQIMIAGRTAPKAKGVDLLEIVVLTGDQIGALAQAGREIGKERELPFFLRDADNILSAQAVILAGTRIQTLGLNCGYCGCESCAAKLENPQMPCALNLTDLGIALGSMTAQAADLRLDCRVMFSMGAAARRIGVLPECPVIYALPLSASAKSPFFDRK
ncbi:MAG: DUF2148 domain-containing protein [Alistipes sp.]|nr:DUF2148 domain-containing protein [Alistipes sp.]